MSRWISIGRWAFARGRSNAIAREPSDANRTVGRRRPPLALARRSASDAMAEAEAWARSALSSPRPRQRVSALNARQCSSPAVAELTCSRRAQRPRGGLEHPRLAAVAPCSSRLLKPPASSLGFLYTPVNSPLHPLQPWSPQTPRTPRRHCCPLELLGEPSAPVALLLSSLSSLSL